MDSITAKNKLSEIISKSYSLEITGNKNEILVAISHPKVQTADFFNSEKEKNIAETVYVDEAKKKINQIEDSNFRIKLENLDRLVISEIIDLCQNASFNIHFITISPY